MGGTWSKAYAVNDAGNVAGVAWTQGDVESHTFSWTKGGGMVDFGTLGAGRS
jgi:probable HAF family extracellular repeat protein